MRSLAWLPLLLAGFARGEVHLVTIDGGKVIGDASYSASLTASGGKQTTLVMRFSGGSRKGSTVSEMETVDRTGRQSAAVFSLGRGTSVLVKVAVEFTPGGDATVTASAGGKSKVRTIQAPKTASRRDLSEFWFLKTVPSVGTWVRYQHLSVGDMAWQQVKTTYVGKRSVLLNGKQVLANELTQTEAGRTETFWLDDDGMPLVVETGSTRLERR